MFGIRKETAVEKAKQQQPINTTEIKYRFGLKFVNLSRKATLVMSMRAFAPIFPIIQYTGESPNHNTIHAYGNTKKQIIIKNDYNIISSNK